MADAYLFTVLRWAYAVKLDVGRVRAHCSVCNVWLNVRKYKTRCQRKA
ncbi:hypothetical protein ACLB1S_16200 [Escherichia coli]